MKRSIIRIGNLFICIFLILAVIQYSFAQINDRSKPPKLGEPPLLKLPSLQHFNLSNGMSVILMEKHQVPLLQIAVLVKAGSANDPEVKTGLASMTAAMMEEGAGLRNSLEFSDAIDFLGATISVSAGWHTMSVNLFTPLTKLDSALSLFGDVVLRPRFPADELERNRKERLTTLIQWRDKPRAIASVLFSKTVFKDDNPYGRQSIGTAKSLKIITVDDLKKFHKTYFCSNNAMIIVVGDVIAKDILGKLEGIFGAWEKGKVEQTAFPEAEQVKKSIIYLVDKPGAPQSEIRIGRIGAQRLTEDYYKLVVMNTILGGSFASRLNQNLREQHGYTYGANSMFNFRLMPGPFMTGSAVQTAVTDSALIQFIYELDRIKEPVTDEELARAKNFLTLRYPENFQSVGQISGQLSEVVTYNLPDSYFNNYSKNILSVSKEDVQQVAQKYIDPAKSIIIIVGDRKQIEKSLSKLKYAEIVNMSVQDVLGAPPVLE